MDTLENLIGVTRRLTVDKHETLNTRIRAGSISQCIALCCSVYADEKVFTFVEYIDKHDAFTNSSLGATRLFDLHCIALVGGLSALNATLVGRVGLACQTQYALPCAAEGVHAAR